MAQKMIPMYRVAQYNGPLFQTDQWANRTGKVNFMIYYTVAFLIVAAIAGLLGFSGVAGTVAWIAKILFYIFVATLLLSLLADKRQRLLQHSRL